MYVCCVRVRKWDGTYSRGKREREGEREREMCMPLPLSCLVMWSVTCGNNIAQPNHLPTQPDPGPDWACVYLWCSFHCQRQRSSKHEVITMDLPHTLYRLISKLSLTTSLTKPYEVFSQVKVKLRQSSPTSWHDKTQPTCGGSVMIKLCRCLHIYTSSI